jgi:hypothetical protein
VSIAAFANALGGKALYDKKLKAMIVNLGQGKAIGKVQNTYTVNGTYYASAEEIVRAIGGSYGWNEKTKTFWVMTGANAAMSDHAMHH